MRASRAIALVSVLSATVTGCLLFTSFDDYDADPPQRVVAGDANVIPDEAGGAFDIRVEVPAEIDIAKPAPVVVHVTRSAPIAVRVSLSLPGGTRVTPSTSIDLDPTAAAASFTVDASLGPRGLVKGTARVASLAGDLVRTADLDYRTIGPGDLDRAFGDGGVVAFPLDSTPYLRGMALEGESIFLAGATGERTTSAVGPTWTLARATSSGLDATFGDAGIVQSAEIPTDAHTVAPLGSELWASGTLGGREGAFQIVLGRYSRTGAPSATATIGSGYGPLAALMAPIPGGGAWIASWDGNKEETLVWRLDANGAVVLGPVHSAIRTGISGAVVGLSATGTDDSPGTLKIVGARLLQAVPYVPVNPPFGALVMGYGADGALDPTFGIQGRALEAFGPDESAKVRAALGFAVRGDGSIVVVGGTSPGRPFIAPFSQDNVRMLVTFFSSDGASLAPTLPNALATCQGVLFDALEDPAGRVVVVGYYGSALDTAVHRLAVVRLGTDGSVDRTFGAPADGATCTPRPGVVADGFDGFASSDARRIMLDAQGRVLVAGRATSSDGRTFWFVSRYRS